MPRREPERTCIVTRKTGSPHGLIRFVVSPAGEVVADLYGKLPGRGAWVTARSDLVREAVRRRCFARAFKADVNASPTLAEEIEAALRRDLRQALSLANKAGAVTTGFAKVEAAINEGRIAALVHAAEAAMEGRRKLAGALRKRLGEAISIVPIIDDLAGEDLDLALGRPNVIHAAVAPGPGGEGFITRWRRLRRYLGEDADAAAPLLGAAAPLAGGAPPPTDADQGMTKAQDSERNE